MMVRKNITNQDENIFMALNLLLHNWQTRSSSFLNPSSLIASVVLISRLSQNKLLLVKKILTLPGIVFAITKVSYLIKYTVWYNAFIRIFYMKSGGKFLFFKYLVKLEAKDLSLILTCWKLFFPFIRFLRLDQNILPRILVFSFSFLKPIIICPNLYYKSTGFYPT